MDGAADGAAPAAAERTNGDAGPSGRPAAGPVKRYRRAELDEEDKPRLEIDEDEEE